MAYFIHNKYDKASIDALAAIDQTANTVIDYYGDFETYKYLDTSAGFGILYDAPSSVTPGTVIHGGQSDKDNSHFNFQNSIVVKSIQRGVFTKSSGSGPTVTVNINKIDASKSMVLLHSGSSGNSTGQAIHLVSLDNTSLVINSDNSKGSYQVIEYC